MLCNAYLVNPCKHMIVISYKMFLHQLLLEVYPNELINFSKAVFGVQSVSFFLNPHKDISIISASTSFAGVYPTCRTWCALISSVTIATVVNFLGGIRTWLGPIYKAAYLNFKSSSFLSTKTYITGICFALASCGNSCSFYKEKLL